MNNPFNTAICQPKKFTYGKLSIYQPVYNINSTAAVLTLNDITYTIYNGQIHVNEHDKTYISPHKFIEVEDEHTIYHITPYSITDSVFKFSLDYLYCIVDKLVWYIEFIDRHNQWSCTLHHSNI